MTGSRSMIDNAFDWARQRNKVVLNPVHGHEEIHIPMESFWSHLNESGSRLALETNFQMEVLWLHDPEPDGP